MSMPKSLSRREILQTATLLGVSAAAVSSNARAAEPGGGGITFAKDSGLVTGKMKALKYDAIPGLLTKEQVTPHYQAHYGGALKRFTTIEQQLDGLYAGKEPLGGDALTFIHKDKVNRMNSVLLHELYFDGLTPRPGDPTEDIRTALAKRFGSLDRWIEDFKICCMAANGWGMLVRDIVNGRLYNVSSDLHEVGVVWLGQPLIVCDVYEHAFYVDYTNRKQEYVNKFVQFIDWSEVSSRSQCLS
ncbi:superoxide dismutase [Anatilimnocola sp. NA78]|uniref:superoxide dismutase n=1 Tax=Anatilimnocola sp. NA78 TaxID=3415683 RepID=UPI003CE5640F